jgi:hypothetical protein
MKHQSLILKTAFAVFFFAFTFSAYAQDPPGIDDFNQATQQLHSVYFSLSDLVLVIGAITGIIGGLRVYTNWQIGGHRHRHPIDSQVIGWFCSCLFLILAGIFIKALYGM